MGLDAVVYRNIAHLKLGSDEELAQLVSETGEVHFQNDELSRKYRPQLEAAEHRLGNVTEIADLREEIIRFVGPESVKVKKMLYSGAHSGDIIPLDLIPA